MHHPVAATSDRDFSFLWRERLFKARYYCIIDCTATVYCRRCRWMQRRRSFRINRCEPFASALRKDLSTLRAAYEDPEVDTSDLYHPILTINNLLTISLIVLTRNYNSHEVSKVNFVISKKI